MIYLDLFLSFFQVGLFSIGGGYASLPLIQNQVVVQHGWLTLKTFTDIITIAEMTPGPIALNAATFVGTKVAGTPGAIVATVAVILPSFLILSLLSYLYFKYQNLDAIQGMLQGIRPTVVALIFGAGLSILILSLFGHSKQIIFSELNYVHVIYVCIAFYLVRAKKLSPIIVMLSIGLLNVLISLF